MRYGSFRDHVEILTAHTLPAEAWPGQSVYTRVQRSDTEAFTQTSKKN